MSVPASQPNIDIRSASYQANKLQSQSQQKETQSIMNDLSTAIKDLKEELSNQQMSRGNNKLGQKSETDSRSAKILEQMKEQTQQNVKQVVSQSQSQQAQMSQNKDADQVAAAMAGLQEEEELGLSGEDKKFEEKMEIMMQHAEKLQDVELDNPDDQQELQEMFKNLHQNKQLKEREAALDKKIEDMELNLKQQDVREAINRLPEDPNTKQLKEQLNISFIDQPSIERGDQLHDGDGGMSHDQSSDQEGSSNDDDESLDNHDSSGSDVIGAQ